MGQHIVCVQGNAAPVPNAAPEAGPYWSLMFEVSESELKPVNNAEEDLAGEGSAPAFLCSSFQPLRFYI